MSYQVVRFPISVVADLGIDVPGGRYEVSATGARADPGADLSGTNKRLS